MPVVLLGIAGGAVLLRRWTAAGLLLVAIALTGAYAWANYLHLEHYLLVPFLMTGILAGVALDGAANVAGLARRGPAAGWRWATPSRSPGWPSRSS